MEILVLGLNHKSAPIQIRERLFVPERDLAKALEMLGEPPQLAERMLVTTCNRVEVYAVTEGPVERAVAAITDCLARYHNLPPSGFADSLYTYTAREAVRH